MSITFISAVIILLALGYFAWQLLWWIMMHQQDRDELQNQKKDEISKRRAVNYSILAKEMGDIYYSKPRYHPTRWYTPAPNYNGKYVTTDRYGLRIDRKKVRSGAEKILFFGGSTMFSTTTRDQGAIPEIINRRLRLNKMICLNYGIGGYSTYAEISAFCEALRRETNCRIAVFYDGVNEIAMYLEMIQSRLGDDFFTHAGFPFMSVTKTALKNYIDEDIKARLPRSIGIVMDALNVLADRFSSATASISLANRDIFQHAMAIATTYEYNIRILHGIADAYSVKPLFIWQPDIFTTKKRLTQWEMQIISNYPPFMPELTQKVKNLVIHNATLVGYGLIDGTGWLDDLIGDHFYDYCHVSEEANEIIAYEIERLIRETLIKSTVS